LVLTVAPETLARLAPGNASVRLAQFTNVADPLFTPLAIGLRRAAMLCAAAQPLAIETLAAAAVQPRSPTQGNDGAETALFGWGARIRTWEWRNQNPQNAIDTYSLSALMLHLCRIKRVAHALPRQTSP
jgi:hypothetical protein